MIGERRFDLLVIGGGINGAGIARDAAGRGCSVLLCEQGDLAAGTSSASSQLIHGGLRYLEQGAFRLVREALVERAVLCRAAPHLVRPLRFVMPGGIGQRPDWLVRLGLLLYDRLGGGRDLPASAGLRLAESPLGAGLRPELTHGFSYWDCRGFDARLVVANAVDAQARGAAVLTRTAFVGAVRAAGGWRVRLDSRQRGRGSGCDEVWVRAIVNAAGPWADRVEGGRESQSSQQQPSQQQSPQSPRLRLVQGSHIVVPRLHEGAHAWLVQNPDRRVVFVIPYQQGFSLIGTTDTPFSGDPAEATASAAEVAYLCAAVSRVAVRPVTPDAVIASFAGVRALVEDGKANPSQVGREARLDLEFGDDGQAPWLSVLGGKLTGYRLLAERALSRLVPWLTPGQDCRWTAASPLPGGALPAGDPESWGGDLVRHRPWLPAPLAARLVQLYGSQADAVLGDAGRLADLGRDYGGGLSERELCWLIEREFAMTAADVLWRRTKLGLVLSAAQRTALAERLGG